MYNFKVGLNVSSSIKNEICSDNNTIIDSVFSKHYTLVCLGAFVNFNAVSSL